MLSCACRQPSLRGSAPEYVERAAQLIRLRPVLGVVDDDEIAARELQGVVQGLGLGARLLVGHHQRAEAAGQIERLQRAWISRSTASTTSMISSLAGG